MSLPDLLIERGESLQYIIFFATFLGLVLLEPVVRRRTLPKHQRHRWPANVALTLTNVLALGFVPVSFISAAFWADSASFGLFNQVSLPAWIVIPGTLLIRGFISTGTHLLNHKVPWLWRIHRVHHLDTELDVTSTVRFHPLEFMINPFIGLPVVVLFGLPAWILAGYELLDIAVTLFSHADIRIGENLNRGLRYLIVTPDLHRIHHSSWQPETDSNFGAVFPIWDVVLGTFRGEPRGRHETMQLGLEEEREPTSNSYLAMMSSPFRRARRAPKDPASPTQTVRPGGFL